MFIMSRNFQTVFLWLAIFSSYSGLAQASEDSRHSPYGYDFDLNQGEGMGRVRVDGKTPTFEVGELVRVSDRVFLGVYENELLDFDLKFRQGPESPHSPRNFPKYFGEIVSSNHPYYQVKLSVLTPWIDTDGQARLDSYKTLIFWPQIRIRNLHVDNLQKK